MPDDIRPDLTPARTAAEFDRWYWPVDLMRAFCEEQGLPAAGTKASLRARIAAFLDGAPAPLTPTRRSTSTFNWAKADLTPDTVITDSITFGPNVRGFFKSAIGRGFSCHGDFMDWMRAHPGHTLADAVDAWHMLEARKDDPTFRRDIASCNTYLRYLRAAGDAHPDLSLDDAKMCWDAKKLRPAPGGNVRFEDSDLALLARSACVHPPHHRLR